MIDGEPVGVEQELVGFHLLFKPSYNLDVKDVPPPTLEASVNIREANELFRAKMGFLAAVLLLELWPALTLVRWRRKAARSGASWTPDSSSAARVRAISYLEAVLVIAMVCAAALMARGYGAAAH